MATAIELARGRTFAVVLEPGESVMASLGDACLGAGITQGFVPVFSGAFRSATLIGTTDPIDDVDAPLRDSVTIENAEGLGSGTIATTDGVLGIHLHVTVGAKANAAAGASGHLLDAVVQYPVEIIIEEVLEPTFERRANDRARGIPTLGFLAE